jgi:hypothetical protein
LTKSVSPTPALRPTCTLWPAQDSSLAGGKWWSLGYHGGVFSFWDSIQENGIDKHGWIIGKYNDVEGTKKLIEENDVAAVLVEGMQGAGGCISDSKGFLMQIQESAKKVFPHIVQNP